MIPIEEIKALNNALMKLLAEEDSNVALTSLSHVVASYLALHQMPLEDFIMSVKLASNLLESTTK